MRYLARLSAKAIEQAPEKAAHASAHIEKKVLACNPFLEAFGNATTLRNDNSSRFGKFLQIEYDGPRIIGARMEHYLLEKARVVDPHEGERNYHMFYLLCSGATEAERKLLSLTSAKDYRYLAKSGTLVVDTIDDKEWMQEVRDTLKDVEIDSTLQTEIFKVLAGILHLGNVDFVPGPTDDDPCTLKNPAVAKTAGELLGASPLPQKLLERLVTVKGRQSSYRVQLNAPEAEKGRDALSKAIYEALFSWIVSKVNEKLGSGRGNSAFIGILDIFGFELFKINSFEQLCINYANEKLQNLFNLHIFVMEQEQYKAEGR